MPEPFKNLFNAAVIDAIGVRLAARELRFDRAGFTAQAGAGLDALELKARSAQITRALEVHLPPDFPAAFALLTAALHPQEHGPITAVTDGAGQRGWAELTSC